MKRYNSNQADEEYLKDRYKWVQFFMERFSPMGHLSMIVLFIAGHSSYVGKGLDPEIILIFIGTTIFFFKLRCFDEVKDFDLDMKINSSRPLPRGLVSVFEVKDVILICLLLENILFYSVNLWAGLSMSLTSLYSLIMYKEFFLSTRFRNRITSYATAHTLVTFFLSFSILSALVNKPIYTLDFELYAFSAMSWLLFNIFELGRKTFLVSEERDQVESYSKVWGRVGAVVFVWIHALTVLMIIFHFLNYSSTFSYYYFGVAFTFFFLVGCYFLISSKGPSGIIFRNFSSFFIILIYLGIVLEKSF